MLLPSAIGVPSVWAQGDASRPDPLDRVPGRERSAVVLPSNVIRVGRSPGAIASVAEAAKVARDGDLVEIEAGLYRGDVAVWLQKRLTLRAKGGPVRLLADGQSAEGKAIWVIRDGDFDIEGIAFQGCRVSDRNGAGIRLERGHLRLRWCKFLDCDTGLLTSNHAGSSLEAESCEFSGCGAGDGGSHNLYVGAIDRCELVACYFARAQVGHLLKSRARQTRVLYCRLTDEGFGNASYEVDLPSGGQALLYGNLIVQEARTQNFTIVSFGAEGYRWPHNDLVMLHNTVVNRRPGDAVFVRGAAGSANTYLANNLFVGLGRFLGVTEEKDKGNHRAGEGAFRAAAEYDFRLVAASGARGLGVRLDPMPGVPATPSAQYSHPMRLQTIIPNGSLSPGAFQV